MEDDIDITTLLTFDTPSAAPSQSVEITSKSTDKRENNNADEEEDEEDEEDTERIKKVKDPNANLEYQEKERLLFKTIHEFYEKDPTRIQFVKKTLDEDKKEMEESAQARTVSQRASRITYFKTPFPDLLPVNMGKTNQVSGPLSVMALRHKEIVLSKKSKRVKKVKLHDEVETKKMKLPEIKNLCYLIEKPPTKEHRENVGKSLGSNEMEAQVMCIPCNMWSTYDKQKTHYQRKHFDACARGDKIDWPLDQGTFSTSYRQLNFFRWILESELHLHQHQLEREASTTNTEEHKKNQACMHVVSQFIYTPQLDTTAYKPIQQKDQEKEENEEMLYMKETKPLVLELFTYGD